MPSPSGLPALDRFRVGLTCFSVAANALCAGGIFIFPLISPTLASRMKLTQPQLTTVVLAGMIGQYPVAAMVGKFFDQYGPRPCSLVSSVLFASSFGLVSLEISRTPEDISRPSSSSFQRLTILFFLAGVGTVFSYFSSVFAASKNFPEYIGIASGTSMALFGLSPLFLSILASTFFTDSDTGLNVTRYLTFLAILSGLVHLFGALTMRTPAKETAIAISRDAEQSEQSRDPEDVDETAPLLHPKAAPIIDIQDAPASLDGTVLDLLKDPQFWVLAVILLFNLGTCEMIMSNIGTIVLSLPSSSSPHSNAAFPQRSTEVAVSTQVRVLSLANTMSRLLAGPLADYVSPVASYLPNGTRCFLRRHFISRVAFLSASSLLLALALAWTELGVRTQENLWVLSIGTGMTYGISFTVLPSIMSSVWGLNNLARNFGVVSYAPFIGTPIFSYLYAFVSARHALDDGVCEGVLCWRLTFWVTTGTALISFCGSTYLWRRWRGRL